MLRVIFVKQAQPSKAGNENGKRRVRLLGPSGRNKRTQAHNMNKWVLRKQVGPKGPEREKWHSWAVYGMEK